MPPLSTAMMRSSVAGWTLSAQASNASAITNQALRRLRCRVQVPRFGCALRGSPDRTPGVQVRRGHGTSSWPRLPARAPDAPDRLAAPSWTATMNHQGPGCPLTRVARVASGRHDESPRFCRPIGDTYQTLIRVPCGFIVDNRDSAWRFSVIPAFFPLAIHRNPWRRIVNSWDVQQIGNSSHPNRGEWDRGRGCVSTTSWKCSAWRIQGAP